MSKRKLINKVAADQSLPKTQVRRVLNALLAQLADQLQEDGRVELRGFGVFNVKTYAAYLGKDPQSGLPVQRPPNRRVTFRASSKLKTKLNQHE